MASNVPSAQARAVSVSADTLSAAQVDVSCCRWPGVGSWPSPCGPAVEVVARRAARLEDLCLYG
jgi:hypothetical protein